MTKLVLIAALLSSVSLSAGARVAEAKDPCFSANEMHVRAHEIFSRTSQASATRNLFLDNLGKEMVSRGCIFDRGAKFDSPADTLTSIETSIKNPFSHDAPPWLRPGFKAALSASDSDNSIFIETTTGTGFVFHICEKQADDNKAIAPRPSADCPVMFNSAVFVPVDEMLERTSGIKRVLSLALRAIANISMVATANFGFALVSPVAQTIGSFWAPNSIHQIQNEFRVRRDTRELLRLGDQRNQEGGLPDGSGAENRIITRLIPNVTYEEMKSALAEVVQKNFAQEYRHMNHHRSGNPHDPNLAWEPALRIERMYYCRVNWDTDPACAKYFPTDPYAKASK